jgi:hypothetical protein
MGGDGRGEEATGTELHHRQAGDKRADDRTQPVDHQETARDLDRRARGRVVIGVGQDHRIHREDGRTEKAHENEVRHRPLGQQQDEGQIGQKRHSRDADKHLATVHPVAGEADGDLRHGARQHRDTGEQRDRRKRQAHAVCVDRRERPEGRVGDPDEKHRRHRDRRIAPERPEVQPHRCQRRGRGRGRQRGRHQREAVDDGRDREEQEAARVAEGYGHLPARGRDEVDHGVDAEDRAARGGLGAVVEPGFDDHRGPGEAEPRHRAHWDPGPGIDDQRLDQDGDRRQRAHHAEGPDMSDRTHEPRRDQAARHVADGPARPQKAQRARRKPLDLAPDRKDEAMHAPREEQEGGSQEQGGDG